MFQKILAKLFNLFRVFKWWTKIIKINSFDTLHQLLFEYIFNWAVGFLKKKHKIEIYFPISSIFARIVAFEWITQLSPIFD